VVEQRHKKKMLVSRHLELPFLKRLLNKNVSEVDLSKLDMHSNKKNLELLEHVFKKCPSIKNFV